MRSKEAPDLDSVPDLSEFFLNLSEICLNMSEFLSATVPSEPIWQECFAACKTVLIRFPPRLFLRHSKRVENRCSSRPYDELQETSRVSLVWQGSARWLLSALVAMGSLQKGASSE